MARIDESAFSDYDSLADLHCQSVLTDRFIQRVGIYSDAYTFSSPSRCGRTGGGRLVRAGSVCPVCQPSLVLPPSFDSDLVELSLLHTGITTMKNNYCSSKQNVYISSIQHFSKRYIKSEPYSYLTLSKC